jgi:hypothetical protein
VQVQGSSGAISFANGNGITFGGNASTVTASHNGLTSQSNQAFSAPGGSSAFQTLVFANSQGVSFSNSNGSVVASVATNYAASNHSHGDPVLALTNLSGTTASNSNGLTISLSAAAGGGGADGYNILAAGTQTAGTATTVNFANSHGISFGMSGSSQITASYDPPNLTPYFSNGGTTFNGANVSGSLTLNTAGLQVSLSVAPGGGGADGYNILAAGTQTAATTGSVLFQNSNGVTFGMSNSSVITASVAAQTVQTQNMVSILGSTGNISFANGNGITFGGNASTVTASHNGLTSQSNQALSGSNGSFTFQTASFGTLNGISFYTSNGSIVASHNALTSQSNQAFSASGGSSTFQTINFVNGNGATFTNNAGSVGLSYTVPSVTQYFSATNTTFNGTNVSGSITLNTNGIRIDLSAGAGGGGVNPAASASNGSFAFTTLNFSNANNVTFGTSAGGIITASVAAPGAAAENNWVALVGANTAGNTTASGSTIAYSGINLTLSGTNGSVVNISAPATSSIVGTGQISISTNGSTVSIGVPNAVTLSGFNPYADIEKIASSIGNGTLMFDPVRIAHVQYDRCVIPINNTNSSNSSGSHTLSFWVGIYSRNASSLSLVQSASTSIALTHSGTAGSYSLYSGQRIITIPMTSTLTEGDYWLGFVSRTTSAGTNGSYSVFVGSNLASNFLGHFGSAQNTTMQLTLGQGVYTATTSGMPGSVGFSQIRGSDSQARKAPFIMFAYSTV